MNLKLQLDRNSMSGVQMPRLPLSPNWENATEQTRLFQQPCVVANMANIKWCRKIFWDILFFSRLGHLKTAIDAIWSCVRCIFKDMNWYVIVHESVFFLR